MSLGKVTDRSRYKVYLAGGIGGLHYSEATDWREYATEYLDKFGIDGISPMRSKEFLKGQMIDDQQEHQDVMATRNAITCRDRWDTTRCDLLIANLLDESRFSIGTCIEIGQADMARVPIIIVCQEGKLFDTHPMVSRICGFTVRSIEEALELAVRIFSI